MRVIVFFVITGMCMLFVAASASAAPILLFHNNSASKPGVDYMCPIKDILISIDNLKDDNLSLHFPLAKVSDANVIEPKTVLAGMLVLQSEDIAALRQAGRQLEDFLIPLFAGSLLIGLSGLIKKSVMKQTLAHREKHPVKAKVSYEKTLWAESHGLM
jgi:hypothetical protein